MKPIIDPRRGDIEDDASSTKRRSLLSLAGTLLSEISLPKLVMAWMLMLIGPCLLLGLSPLIASAWVAKISGNVASPYLGLWPMFLLVLLLAIGWFGGRPLLRLVERSFWTLNSLVIEPSYAATREGLQQLVEQLLPERTAKTRRSRIRAATAAAAGILICALALLTLMLAWPGSRWIGAISDLASPLHLAPIALSNGVVLLAVYLAVIALVWALGDATMSQPRDFHAFYTAPETGRRWRVAHLSDLHVVGERYGFRIESGRSGPRGNERLKQVLGGLAALHGNNPLDAILITGDMTDAGRSAEWAEFLDALALYPGLAERILVLPGNHDLNVVDRANPARLDLPTSPSKRLRQIRTLSVMDQLQGRRVRVVDHAAARLGGTLADVLEPHRAQIAEFADAAPLLAFHDAGRLMGQDLSAGACAGIGRRAGNHAAELKRRNAFFVHQCTRIDLGRAGERDRDRCEAIPASLLAHRSPSSSRRISSPGESIFRAHRHRTYQWQLVSSSHASLGWTLGSDARSSPYRLDRRMRRASDNISPLPGDERAR